jgi:hypothetical protein
MMAFLVIIVAFFLFYIASPFFERAFRKREIQEDGFERENLRFRKEEILEALKDLEYDYKMRKIAEPDYLKLKEDLTSQAVEIMKKTDPLKEKHVLTGTRRIPTKS